MAVIEEEVDFVGEIDYQARAQSNKEFSAQEKIQDFIEERTKKHKSFNEVECPGCEKEIEDNEEVVDLDCNTGHTYHVDCLKEQLKKEWNCKICDAKIEFKRLATKHAEWSGSD